MSEDRQLEGGSPPVPWDPSSRPTQPKPNRPLNVVALTVMVGITISITNTITAAPDRRLPTLIATLVVTAILAVIVAILGWIWSRVGPSKRR